jgi:hypothetical protein
MQIRVRWNEGLKALLQAPPDARGGKIMSDRETGLTQKPENPNSRCLVPLLPPQGLVVALA